MTGWAWTLNTSSQDSPSQLCKAQTSLTTSWVYGNRTTTLIQNKPTLLLDSSPSPQSPGRSQEQQAPLTPCLLGPLLSPQLSMLRTGASRCCHGCTLSCASNDCHGVTLLPYTHPSHSSGCIFLMLSCCGVLRFSCFYSAPLFHFVLVIGMRFLYQQVRRVIETWDRRE